MIDLLLLTTVDCLKQRLATDGQRKLAIKIVKSFLKLSYYKLIYFLCSKEDEKS
jgi:hypothetical protein